MAGWVRGAIVIGAWASFLFPDSSAALDPQRSIHQYKHTTWTREDGVPSPITDLDQGEDGFLWLSSRDGVFRFDGISFERIDAEVDLGSAGSAGRILVTKAGDIWIYYNAAGRFAVYRNGRVRFVPSPEKIGTVIFLLEGADGAIWALHGEPGRPFYRHYKGRWKTVDPLPGERDYLWSALVAPDGTLWAAFGNHIVRLPVGATSFERVFTFPRRRSMLVVDREGRLWSPSSTDIRLLRGRSTAPLPPASHAAPLTISPRTRRQRGVFDNDGNLWVANGFEGVERISGLGPELGSRTGGLRIESLSRRDGVSGFVEHIFADREGNIWLTTTRGLERFRDVNIAVEPSLAKVASFGDVLLSTSQGDVYIGEADAVYRARPGETPKLLVAGEPEAMCEGPDGTVWMIFNNKVVRFDGSGLQTSEGPPPRETAVYACAVDHRNRLWITAAGSGAYTWDRTGWRQVPPTRPGENVTPTNIASTGGGSFWMRWNDTALARLTPNGPVLVRPSGLADLTIRGMHWTSGGLFFTGNEGLGRLNGTALEIVGRSQVPSLVRTTGFVQTPQGESWVFGWQGLIRMKTADLERAFMEPHYKPPSRVFGFEDGLPDIPSAQSMRSLVRGGDGRLWFSTAAGASWLDPSRLRFNRVAPGAVVTRLTAGNVAIRDPGAVKLKPGTAGIQIDFSVPSLSLPEAVKVLYKLEGYDAGWIDPGTRRQAIYTNLAPGSYRFKVIAANSEGVWNRQGDTLELTLPPTFLQSLWFKLLCLVAAVGLGVVAYQLRFRRITARLQRQFEVRVAERERIARELHDTLLQGIQGLMLRFQAAANRVAAPEVRETLDDALERADAVLVEGRARVRDLRRTSESGELAQRLIELTGALVEGEHPRVDLTVEGERRELHPLVLEEALRIAEEAVRNVVHHAGATRLDIEIVYGSDVFAVRLRDDGKGIPKAVLDEGKRAGHFGLVGMRERAHQIGGELCVRSVEGRGTEVALLVPPRAAYSDWRFRLRDLLRFEQSGPAAR